MGGTVKNNPSPNIIFIIFLTKRKKINIGVNIRQIIKRYVDDALASNRQMRKDKKGFILHIPCCRTTHKPLQASTKISQSSEEGHLVVVKNHDTLFKLLRTTFPEYH